MPKPRNPEYYKIKTLNKFGLTVEQYQQMLQAQEYKCAICGQLETSKAKGQDKCKELSVDHCHRKGHVRRLLCLKCNTALGYFKEDSKRILKAKEYLEKHRK